MSDPTVSTADRHRQRLVIACAALATFMGTLDEFVVGVSLPSIAHEFGVGTGAVSWVVIAYLLAVTGTLIVFGRLADRFGLRRLFLIGYGVFVLGSLLCGLAWGIGPLIGFRFVQGLGGSMLRVVAYALVVAVLPKQVRGWGYGILSTASATGILVGTPVGGLITGLASWHWIFLVNVPIGVAAAVMALRVLPPDPPARRDGSGIDLPGATLVLAGVSLLLVGLTLAEEYGPGSVEVLGILGGAVAVLAAFVYRQRTAAHPLIELSLLRNRAFLLGNAAMFLTCMYMTGDAFLLPFYLQLSSGASPQLAGMLLLAYSLAYIPTAQVAGRLSDRVSPSLLSSLAMLSGAGACLYFILVAGTPGWLAVVVYMVWGAASCAMFISPNNNNVMSNATEGQAGSASGILSTATQLGSAVGVVLFESAFSLGGVSSGIDTITELRQDPDTLLSGFRQAYLLGIVVCLAAAYLAYRSGRVRRAPVAVPRDA